jgi:phage-related protein
MNPWDVRFYETGSGNNPVDDFLNDECDFIAILEGRADSRSPLKEKLARKIVSRIALLRESGPILKRPYASKLEGTGDLWELIIDHYRILYFISGRDIVLVHAFIKKTNQTPQQAIKVGEQRKKDWERRFRS